MPLSERERDRERERHREKQRERERQTEFKVTLDNGQLTQYFAVEFRKVS